MFTIKQVLEIIPSAKLVAGENGINNAIDYVDILEVPDACSWIKANTLLITTGYSVKNNLSAQEHIIETIAKMKASGLAVKFERYIGNIPPNLIELSNKLNVPLISLNSKIPYIDITYPIMMHIINEQAALLSYSNNVYSKLSNIALTTGSLEKLALELSTLLHYSVHIYMYNIRKDILHSDSKRQVFPVSLKNKIYGYIEINADHKLTDKEMIAVKHTQILVALHMVNKELTVESTHKEQRDFLDDIISHKIPKNQLSIRAEELNISLNKHKYALLANIDDFSKYIIEHKLSESHINNIKNNFGNIIRQCVHKIYGSNNIFAVRQSDKVFILFPVDSPDNQKIKYLLQKIRASFKMYFSDIDITIAISKTFIDITELPIIYSKIRCLISICRKMNGSGHDILWDEAETYLLINEMDSNTRLYYRNLLSGLENDVYATQLIKTLNAYIKNHGNITQSSKDLFIHRNTLSYRLKKIATLLGRNIDSSDTQFLLWLALKERELRQHNI